MAYFEEEMLKETSDLEEIQYSEETLKVFIYMLICSILQ